MRKCVLYIFVMVMALLLISGCASKTSEIATKRELYEVTNRVRELEKRLNEKDIAIEQLTAVAKNMETELAGLRNKVKAINDKNVAKFSDLYSDLEDLHISVQELQNRLTSLSDEAKYYSKKAEHYARLLEARAMDRTINQQMNDLAQKNEELFKRIQSLQEENAKLNDRIIQIEAKLEVLLKAELERKKSEEPPPEEVKIPEPPRRELTEEEMYQMARDIMEKGDYTTAIEKFQKFINKYPDSNLADNAQYWIGECFYALGKYEDAVVEFDKVARNYRKSNKIPDAMLKQAFSFCKLKEIYACKQILLDLIKKYPDSEAASKAKVELNKLK